MWSSEKIDREFRRAFDTDLTPWWARPLGIIIGAVCSFIVLLLLNLAFH